MEHTDFTQGDLLTDEGDFNLDMLCASMMNWVTSHVDDANIVTVDNGRALERLM